MRNSVIAAAVAALLVGCGSGGGDPSVSTAELTVGQRLIVEATDCAKLQRGVDTRAGYLAAQAADPGYGMSPDEIEAAERSNTLAAARMTELGC